MASWAVLPPNLPGHLVDKLETHAAVYRPGNSLLSCGPVTGTACFKTCGRSSGAFSAVRTKGVLILLHMQTSFTASPSPLERAREGESEMR